MKRPNRNEPNAPLAVGSRIEEIGCSQNRHRLGEICGILDDRRGRAFELILLNPHDLSPVIRGDLGSYKRFKLQENRCIRLDEEKYAGKRTFRIGDVIRKSYDTFVRYGIIVNFVHPDGILSSSHLKGYNGRDLLECVEVSRRPGLQRIRDKDGNLKRFTTSSYNCQICKLKPMDKKGGLRLDTTASNKIFVGLKH